jgi:hypothetical protein
LLAAPEELDPDELELDSDELELVLDPEELEPEALALPDELSPQAARPQTNTISAATRSKAVTGLQSELPSFLSIFVCSREIRTVSIFI